ncbi:MAG: hypothetical protein AB1649_01235 [Chloroflexota bacterium]
MSKITRILASTVLLVLAVSACASPVIPTSDPNFVNTSVVQTGFAAFTQSAQAPSSMPIVLEPTLTFTPTPTFTPTLTPTSTLTPTPLFTATPLVPLISVSVPTNCRHGPGRIYDYRGALLVGETAEVVARDATGNYWYVRNPDSAGNYCWLWGKYATISGNVSVLPIYTPPPTPTATFTPTPSPNFNSSYSSLDTCNNNWWIEVRIKNNGSVSFRSVEISVKDTVSNIEVVDLSDGFTDIDGCVKTTTKDIIAPGDTYLLSAPPFNYNPTGHALRAFITLCTETGQKGICITDRLDVTP